jgi:hypothetical protein
MKQSSIESRNGYSMSSLIEAVFGKRRSKTPSKWDASAYVEEALKPSNKRLPSTRAQERLESQRKLYQQILLDPTKVSVDEVKQKAMIAAAAAANKELENEPLEVVFEKACRRLFLLWDQVGVEQDVRNHIKATTLTGPPTLQGLQVLHAEIQRLASARAAERELASAIESRESFLYILQEAAERSMSGESTKDVKIAAVINSVRIHSFQVVESLNEWRRHLGYDAIYLWRGTSYILKMSSDLLFLVSTPLLSRVGCAIAGNPMLNPVRKIDAIETFGGVRTSTGVASGSAPSGEPKGAVLPPINFKGSSGPFGYVPAKKSTNGASSLLYTPERYADAESTIRREPALYREFLAQNTPVSFAAPETEEPEVDPVVMKAVDEIRFVPEDIQAAIEEQSKLAEDGRRARAAAVVLQRVARGIIGRRLATSLRKKHEAARKIQSLYRVWAARKRAAKLKERKRAAMAIQSIARGGATRVRAQVAKVQGEAAAKVQALYRGWKARREVNLWRMLWLCAIRIQKVFRSYASRKRTLEYKKQTYNAAASNIQKVWKGLRLRESGVADPRRLKAATRIQRVVRGFLARSYYIRLKEVNDKARKITAVIKGHHTRQQVGPVGKSRDVTRLDDSFTHEFLQ